MQINPIGVKVHLEKSDQTGILLSHNNNGRLQPFAKRGHSLVGSNYLVWENKPSAQQSTTAKQ